MMKTLQQRTDNKQMKICKKIIKKLDKDFDLLLQDSNEDYYVGYYSSDIIEILNTEEDVFFHLGIVPIHYKDKTATFPYYQYKWEGKCLLPKKYNKYYKKLFKY